MRRDAGTSTVRRPPPLVWAVTVALGLVGAVWSIVLPLGEGPDEPAHLGLVLHLAANAAYPDYDDLQRTVADTRLCAVHAAAIRACPAPGETVTADAVRPHPADKAPQRAARPDWDDDGGAAPTVEPNQMPQHPPLYYAAMAGVLRVERMVRGGPASLDRELALLRLVNVVLVLPLPTLAWLTARRAGAPASVAELAPVALLGVPMLSATAATVNNDNLLVLAGALLAPLLAAAATGDRRPRTAALVGAVVALGLLTKAFAVVFLPAVVLAYVVGRRRDADGTVADRTSTDGARPPTWQLVSGFGLGLVLPALWFARTWARTGSWAPSVDARRYTADLRPPGFSADLPAYLWRFVGLLSERFWGSFGWYTARLPGPVTVVSSLVAVALLLVGLVATRAERHRAGRGSVATSTALVLLSPAALLLAFTLARAWSLHARSGQYPFIQGRYLFAGVVGLAVVAALGWHRIAGRHRIGVPVMVVAVVAMQGYAVERATDVYWRADGSGVSDRVDSMAAWSGLPTGVVAPLLVAGAVALVVLVVVSTASATSRATVASPVPSDAA